MSDGRIYHYEPAPVVTIQYPYRAVICGEEHIVQGWRDGNILTDKGEFVFRRLQGKQVESEWPGEIGRVPGNYSIESTRIWEVATLQSNGNGGWLLNGRDLMLLQFSPAGCRLHGITSSEVLRVRKKEIQAVAWVEAIGCGSITAQLDTVLADWKSKHNPGINPAFDPLSALNECVSGWFAGWSKPIWLTEFRPLNGNPWFNGLNEILQAAELASTPPQLSVAEMLKQGKNPWLAGVKSVPAPLTHPATSGDAVAPITELGHKIDAVSAKIDGVDKKADKLLADTQTLKDMGAEGAASRDKWRENPLCCREAMADYLLTMHNLKIGQGVAVALLGFAYGNTRRQAATEAKVSEATIKRALKAARGTDYAKLFARTRPQKIQARQGIKKPDEAWSLIRKLAEEDPDKLRSQVEQVIQHVQGSAESKTAWDATTEALT